MSETLDNKRWKDVQKHGYGKKTWRNNYYEGSFEDDIIHGYGKMTWENGNIYEGHYKNGKQFGVGVVTKANGKKYQIEIDDNQEIVPGSKILL